MTFGRPRNPKDLDPDLRELAAAEEAIDSEIDQLERLITEAPRKIRAQQDERRTVMPPPDDLDDRRRQTGFDEALRREEIRNQRRSQTLNLFLLILLVAATLATCLWVYGMVTRAASEPGAPVTSSAPDPTDDPQR